MKLVLKAVQWREKRLGVLLLGSESVSRLNLLRTMPKTVKYLRRGGWLEMSEYNNMGDNTLPNLAAVLTSLSMGQMRNQCWTSHHSNFDNRPFIWKNFFISFYCTTSLITDYKYT
jgi:hypothetical protein